MKNPAKLRHFPQHQANPLKSRLGFLNYVMGDGVGLTGWLNTPSPKTLLRLWLLFPERCAIIIGSVGFGVRACGGIAIEPRYVMSILDGIDEAGLVFTHY